MGMHGASHPIMTYLDRVLVSEIHTVDPWEQATRGTLLQDRTPGRATGFACVHGPQIGETFENLDMKTVIGISDEIGVQLRSILYAGSAPANAFKNMVARE